jgi:CcmD family protein
MDPMIDSKCQRYRSVIAALILCFVLLISIGAPSILAQQPARPTAAQDGFVPVDQLPAGDRLPAAPLLIGAYAAAWVVIFLYVWSLWRRLSRVEQEIAALSRRVERP